MFFSYVALFIVMFIGNPDRQGQRPKTSRKSRRENWPKWAENRKAREPDGKPGEKPGLWRTTGRNPEDPAVSYRAEEGDPELR